MRQINTTFHVMSTHNEIDHQSWSRLYQFHVKEHQCRGFIESIGSHKDWLMSWSMLIEVHRIVWCWWMCIEVCQWSHLAHMTFLVCWCKTIYPQCTFLHWEYHRSWHEGWRPPHRSWCGQDAISLHNLPAAILHCDSYLAIMHLQPEIWTSVQHIVRKSDHLSVDAGWHYSFCLVHVTHFVFKMHAYSSSWYLRRFKFYIKARWETRSLASMSLVNLHSSTSSTYSPLMDQPL